MIQTKLSIVTLLFAGIVFFLFPLSNSSAQESSVPTQIANAERGLLIYQERCAACHGIGGGGDGELAPQAINPPTAFNEAAFRLTAVPSDMVGTISNGRITDGMPPFGAQTSSPLSDQDLWDVVAAIYSMSTPADSVALGNELFADAVDAEAVDLTDLSLWAEMSNEEMAVFLQGEGVVADEITALVDYARGTFSYSYIDPFAPLEPIETAVIQGNIANGSSDFAVDGGDVILRAFTIEFEETLVMTTTADVDGNYAFDLADVQPDWVYLVTTQFGGYRFNSEPGLLDTAVDVPRLELPIIVYEESNDAANVQLDQFQIFLSFTEERLEVAELYQFSNSGNTIFVGQTGDPNQGTVQIQLPANAQDVLFERGFGQNDFFSAMEDMVQTEAGWADTFPLRPGAGTLEMVVRYSLLYEDGIQHALPYGAENVTLIMPDAGVAPNGAEWEFLRQDDFGGGNFNSYAHVPFAIDERVNLTFDDRPTLVADPQGNIQLVRNETNELIVGGAALLLAVGTAVFMVKQWRGEGETAVSSTPDDLLEAIADLDDEFEGGNLSHQKYEQERELLKTELINLWK